jgi:hypothetical protein
MAGYANYGREKNALCLHAVFDNKFYLSAAFSA